MLTLSTKSLKGEGLTHLRGVYRISENPSLPKAARKNQILLLRSNRVPHDGYPAVLTLDPEGRPPESILLPEQFFYLREGDVVRLDTKENFLRVLYRRESKQNSLLVTERCNHFCIMCSQPPRKVDDSYLVDELMEAIPLMSPETGSIGITGGEPTLLGSRFIDLLRCLKNNLPSTGIHVLSNGRNFIDLELCEKIAAQNHADLMFGIPVYSEIPERHNFVVQAENAWDETIQGIVNLRRYGISVEIRVVLHSQTVKGVAGLASFIARNLTMVNHVAFMGLEKMGFGSTNWNYLFVNPRTYAPELQKAVSIIEQARIPVSIYNVPLCMLPVAVHSYARKSISDWKNDYPEECAPCSLKRDCAGFFSSTVETYSKLVLPQ